MSSPANAATVAQKRQVYLREHASAEPDGDCLIAARWRWRDPDGYVPVKINQIAHGLHRLALEYQLGRELIAGEQANHLCHRRDCINHEHVYAGSQSDNVADMVRAGRGVNLRGEAHGSSILSAREVAMIRERYAAGGVLQRELAVEFGTSPSQISKIVQRVNWV